MADKKPTFVVTTTTTTSSPMAESPTCLVWTSLILGILVSAGSFVPFNPGLLAVGLLSSVGSALYLFACSPTVRMVAYWVLFSAMIIEGLASLALIGFGIALMANPDFLGLGFFFGIIALILSVPVIAMTIIDLTTITRIHPIVFAKPDAETKSGKDVEAGEKNSEAGAVTNDEEATAGEEEDVSTSAVKLPLLSFK